MPEHHNKIHMTRKKWWSITMLAALLVQVIGAGFLAPSTAFAVAPIGQGFELNASDLRFILQQIKIAENHAAGGTLLGTGPYQVPDPTLPYGLRTVDGSFNNLQPGQSDFGRADRAFPRLLTPIYRTAETFDPDGPGPAPAVATSYTQRTGLVADSLPRLVSNLIVDQTPNNPAAVAAAGPGAVPDSTNTLFIANVAPDVGLSAPFNSWFTLFGQFFDHGLDLVTKGGSGTVFIPLQPDDPLYVPGSPTNFMILTRATNQPGPDGVLGTSDDIQEGTNTTTPFVDQNQTYTSHPAHQVFLREYSLSTGRPLPTGRLLDGALSENIANWAEVKAQAASVLGIALSDTDVFNVPLIATDPYGHFLPGPNGFPQVVFPGAVVIEGNPLAPVSVAGALRTGHAFLDDIAHNAVPDTYDHDANPATPRIAKSADADSDVSAAGDPQPFGTYDNELLDLHFITGDGRGNENIGLTAVHSVFHSEHNRLVGYIHDRIVGSPTVAALLTPAEAADWQRIAQLPGSPADPAGPNSGWAYGERLFQAARFVTEMQYQHLVFEEFGRKVQPQINVFAGYHTEIDPAISAEFAHTVYRFGHSMLNETVDRTLPDGSTANILLFDAFLNPLAFNDHDGNPATAPVGADVAVGVIAQGMTRQVGNEIDEFVTDALRNRLVGLPLDLAALNMARARSEGIPGLNEARRQFFAATGDPALAPYENWVDFSFNIKHIESLNNFMAAYGTHPIIASLDPDGPGPIVAGSIEARRIAVDQILNGTRLGGPDGFVGDNPLTVIDESLDDTPANGGAEHPVVGDDPLTAFDESLDDSPANPGPDGVLGDDPLTFIDESLDDILAPADREDFVYGIGAWANVAGRSVTGLEGIDFWVGGLAEKQAPFGGMLGSSFNFVFETQMEDLQDGDRFYYLARTAGLNLLVQLEGNSFSELIMRNSTAEGLPAEVFARPDFVFNIGALGTSGAILNDPTTEWDESQLVIRNSPTVGTFRFAGAEHVVWNGTANGDRVFSSEGDDTIRLNDGNDWAEGGAGNDQFIGGNGNDILNDTFGDDVIKGGPGNDAISSGQGFDLNQGGTGSDFVIGGSDPTETFGGAGNDFVFAGNSSDTVFGDDGDDWIEGGNQADLLQGDNGAPFQNDVNQAGNDVIIGDGGNDDYDSEGGDDIMVAGPGIERNEGMLGFDWVTYRGDPQAANADMRFTGLLPVELETNRDRFDAVEAISGWNLNDTIAGDNRDGTVVDVGVEGTFIGHELTAAGIARVDGLAALLPAGTTVFANGNILIGGAGSDTIEGRGGNDIIDGDRWLNVQLRAPNPATADPSDFQLVNSMQQLRIAVFAGQIDPGDITIVRTIVNTGALPSDIDTAVFSGLRAEYTITLNGDGSFTINHNGGIDGVDTLWNMERAQFADLTLELSAAGINTPASGTIAISNVNPIENGLLTATPSIIDPDGVPATITLTWEALVGAVWTPVATGANFTPTQAQVGQQLRVVARFTDNLGIPETVTSDPTAAVLNVNNLPVGLPTLNAEAALPQEGELITSNASLITDLDGMVGVTLSYQWQRRNGGAFANIPGATNATFTPTQAEVGLRLRVLVLFTDNQGTLETVGSAETGVVGDLFAGSAAADTFAGTAGRDNASGAGGNDTLNGAGADDILAGNGGNDTINAGAGNDIIRFGGAADGFDAINGNAGTDQIVATANNTVIGLSSLAGIEEISGGAFSNVTILGSAAANTLNFAGVVLTNIVSIDGGGGNDTITGTGLADIILGGAGADIINGANGNDTITGGAGNDTLNGGAGTDTFVFAAGFGADQINAFDANPAGGQDRLDISALGITAANFAANVTIGSAAAGADTVITIGANTIRLVGVAPAAVNINDFIVAP